MLIRAVQYIFLLFLNLNFRLVLSENLVFEMLWSGMFNSMVSWKILM